MATASYGIRLSATPVDNCTLTIQRATDSGFTLNVTTVYTKDSAIAGTAYGYIDYLGVQSTVYYYRCKESKTGYADSAWSSTVSSAPYDLGT